MSLKSLAILTAVCLFVTAGCGNPRTKGIELIAALKAGEAEKAERLIKSGADVELIDSEDKTALDYAEAKGITGIVRLIIAAKLNVRDSMGRTPLMRAIGEGKTEEAIALVENGVDIHIKDKNKDTALHYALQKADAPVVKLLLDRDADVNAENMIKETPLHRAIQSADAELVELLLKKGARVNAKDQYGRTPLELEMYWGKENIVQLLLQAGAQTKPIILWKAITDRKKELVILLLDNGARVNDKYSGYTPLARAAFTSSAEIVGILINAGAKLNQKSDDGNTPLINAVSSGQREIVEKLIEAGSDLMIKSSSGSSYYRGKTALMLAEQAGKKDIAELLYKAEKRIK